MDAGTPNEEAATSPLPTTGAPRWVKVTGVVLLILLVVFVVSQIIGGGHGPGRHGSLGTIPAIASSA